MAVNDSQSMSAGISVPAARDDRYCRNCSEIAMAYDPAAGSARCRSCGELR